MLVKCRSPSTRGLGLSEIRWLANGTQVETGKSPLPLLLDKHQCGAKLRLDAIAAIGSILDLTAGQDGCIVVHAHFDLVQVERFVLQVTTPLVQHVPGSSCTSFL